jgi:putative hydrolase of HD superfamily
MILSLDLNMERLEKQIEFIVEIDKLKHVYRQTVLMDRSRNENDAEHSWHLSMLALLLSEYANEENLNLLQVIKMILIHDLVEIDAGDTFVYDDKGYEDKRAREEAAAERIFRILPEDQSEEIYELWEEFEKRETAEARFASAVDRLQPLLHNYYTKGHAWKKHGITSEMVLDKNKTIAEGSKDLWKFAQKIVHNAVEKGYLEK